MCDFVSWIECADKTGKIHRFWLTADLIYYTKRGRELKKYCQISQDLIGHGAIEHYYGIKGKHCECTDFSDPKNFPDEIVADIKAGKMRGMGLPRQMLTNKTRGEYNKVCDEARAEYNKVCDEALGEYEKIRNKARAQCKKICNAARGEYEKICDKARDEFDKICDAARGECNKVCNAARGECDKICQQTFWDLFADPKNRIKVWK
jgi:vacuolar-type H+-ATPase subunit H